MIWCLHGNIGLSQDWNILSRNSPYAGEMIRRVDLWRYLECRSLDLKEFGEVFAAEVAAQDADPYLLGYSMGGRLALHTLLARPELWKGATLLSTHPGLTSEEEKQARRAHDAEWSTHALSLSWSDFLKKWNEQAVLGAPPADLPDRHLLQPRSQAVARAFNAWSLGGQEDFRELSPQIPCPVHLITGEKDAKYTRLATEFQFPHQSHSIVPEAGHRPLWEAPEATLDLLKQAYLSS